MSEYRQYVLVTGSISGIVYLQKIIQPVHTMKGITFCISHKVSPFCKSCVKGLGKRSMMKQSSSHETKCYHIMAYGSIAGISYLVPILHSAKVKIGINYWISGVIEDFCTLCVDGMTRDAGKKIKRVYKKKIHPGTNSNDVAAVEKDCMNESSLESKQSSNENNLYNGVHDPETSNTVQYLSSENQQIHLRDECNDHNEAPQSGISEPHLPVREIIEDEQVMPEENLELYGIPISDMPTRSLDQFSHGIAPECQNLFPTDNEVSSSAPKSVSDFDTGFNYERNQQSPSSHNNSYDEKQDLQYNYLYYGFDEPQLPDSSTIENIQSDEIFDGTVLKEDESTFQENSNDFTSELPEEKDDNDVTILEEEELQNHTQSENSRQFFGNKEAGYKKEVLVFRNPGTEQQYRFTQGYTNKSGLTRYQCTFKRNGVKCLKTILVDGTHFLGNPMLGHSYACHSIMKEEVDDE